MIFLLLFERLQHPTGENSYLNYLQPDELANFLKDSKRSVVVFEDGRYILDFMNFGIYRYRDEINFTLANITNAEKYGCTQSPCIRAFNFDQQIVLSEPEQSPIRFCSWLEQVKEPREYKIQYPEQLRSIFEKYETCVLGVDLNKRPKEIPEETPFYLINSGVFEHFKLHHKVNKGLYIYRHADRQLLPMKGNYEAMHKALLVDYEANQSMIYSNKFFGGFLIENDASQEECQSKVDILNELAKKYKQINFALVAKSQDHELAKLASMEKAVAPYFFMINVSGINERKRYVLVEEYQMNDLNFLQKYVQGIVDGKNNNTLISQRIPLEYPDCSFHQIVASNFRETVLKDSEDALIVITANWCSHCQRFKPVLNITSQILKPIPSIKLYWMDSTSNDIPKEVPEFSGYPTLFLFPAHKKDKPVEFNGSHSMKDVIEFVKANSAISFEVPKYNETELNQKIKLAQNTF